MSDGDDKPTDNSWTPPVQTTPRRSGLSLTVVDGPGAGQRHVIPNKNQVVIGRNAAADVVLDDASVSGAHMELTVEDDGVHIRDLESTNGTWIGAARILHAVIDVGARVVVGNYTLALSSIDTHEAPLWPKDYFGEMFGQSITMRAVFAEIAKIAKTPLTVLVTGETGTGKELVARALHGASTRSNGPWGVFDCAGESPSLFESSLFGHRRGAFTGAVADHVGWFEASGGGSLLIDEIGELPLELQSRLLRVLENGQFHRLGETKMRTADVRIIAATNRDLLKMVGQGKFREDLYFRLAQAKVHLPPLRQREGDALFIADEILRSVAQAREMPLRFTKQSRGAIAAGLWPGNIRELKNAVRVAAHASDGAEVELSDIQPSNELPSVASMPSRYWDAHAVFDRRYLWLMMARVGGSRRATAKVLGISRNTLDGALERAGLKNLK